MTRVASYAPWRASFAVALAAVVTVAATMEAAFGSGMLVDSPVAMLVAAAVGFMLGAWTPVPLAAAWVALLAVALTFANQRQFPGEYPVVDDLVFFLLLLGTPAVAGAGFLARTRQVRDLTALSERLARRHHDEVAAARLEEQHRIELAVHHRLVERLGAIALRAEGAWHEVGPDAARRALADVEAHARSGLDELREALGLLRDDTHPPLVATVPRSTADRPPVGLDDLLLAAGLGAAVAVEAAVSDVSRSSAAANVLAAAAVAVPLVVRRRHPVLVVAVTLLLGAAMSSRLTPWSEMVTPIAVLLVVAYALGSHARGWRRLAGVGALWIGCLVLSLAGSATAPDVEALLPTIVWSGLAVLAGALTAGWSDRAARMRDMTADLERTHATEVRVAVAWQRQLMARDLHDSVAHTLTAVCLSASAARKVGDAVTADLLTTIAETSRAGMAELRHGLDVLVPTDGPLQPRTMQAMARALGVELRLDVPAELSLDTASAALLHRILRESIVNTARYAGGSSMVARMEQRDGAVMLAVTDDGQGTADRSAPPGARLGTGNGLTGLAAQLRERGGRLTYGPLPERGFGVTAILPVPTGVSR